jgi:hypothetical protein
MCKKRDLGAALSLAMQAHSGEYDPFTRRPWIEHVMRVADRCSGDSTTRIVALLHDIFGGESQSTAGGDWKLTYQDVRNAGLGDYLPYIQRLTRQKGETFSEYVQRVAEDDLTTTVALFNFLDHLTNGNDIPASMRDRYIKAIIMLARTPESWATSLTNVFGELEAA